MLYKHFCYPHGCFSCRQKYRDPYFCTAVIDGALRGLCAGAVTAETIRIFYGSSLGPTKLLGVASLLSSPLLKGILLG